MDSKSSSNNADVESVREETTILDLPNELLLIIGEYLVGYQSMDLYTAGDASNHCKELKSLILTCRAFYRLYSSKQQLWRKIYIWFDEENIRCFPTDALVVESLCEERHRLAGISWIGINSIDPFPSGIKLLLHIMPTWTLRCIYIGSGNVDDAESIVALVTRCKGLKWLRLYIYDDALPVHDIPTSTSTSDESAITTWTKWLVHSENTRLEHLVLYIGNHISNELMNGSVEDYQRIMAMQKINKIGLGNGIPDRPDDWPVREGMPSSAKWIEKTFGSFYTRLYLEDAVDQ